MLLRLSLLTSCLVCLVSVGGSLAAQAPSEGAGGLRAAIALPEPASKPQVSAFAQRRERVRALLGDDVLLLVGARKPGDMGPFVQDQDFLYLTGVAEPGCALLLRGGEAPLDVLLAPPFSRFAAQWEGEFLAPGEKSAAQSGFAEVRNARQLADEIQAAVGDEAKGRKLWGLFRPAAPIGGTPGQSWSWADEQRQDPLDGRKTREEATQEALRRLLPKTQIAEFTERLHALRAHKDEVELMLLRRSAEIAADGIAEAMRSVHPGMYEGQLAAVARYVFSLRGAGPDAYGAIVGAGKNGCVLHYMKNDARIEPADLIVMDYAPTLHGYASDVTRTFPASGRFTSEQRKLVQDVYDVQQAILAEVKPGARLSALGALCGRLLRQLGYKSDHGPCHHVGLAVHDPSVDELQAGMVITVEPGAYLRKEGMGCRIEDTVLVTESGFEVLSAGLPAQPDEIEAWMQKEGVVQIPVGLPVPVSLQGQSR